MTQETALKILKMGKSVFLTGAPGAGKTYVLNQYIQYLQKHKIKVAVTASTGIAATHIGGTTIHAWSGLGIRKGLSAYDLEAMLEKQYLFQQVTRPSVLIIDEISMLHGEFLDMVDRVCKAIRQTQKPFGGLQVIFTGDFFQLPPVGKNERNLSYAFESAAWAQLDPKICYLTEQFRQSDDTYLKILTALRRGVIQDAMMAHFRVCYKREFAEGVQPTRLYTHNADVDEVNRLELDSLDTKTYSHTMTATGNKKITERLMQSCLSPEILHLKVGAVVMCTKNNFDDGYVNGTMGVIETFQAHTNYPMIRTYGGDSITIKPSSWAVIDNGKAIAEIKQIPLRLAWAITVHKSQGMSIDVAEMDLAQCFEYGQGYVALSRVRSLSGLRLLGLNKKALQVDPAVQVFDRSVFGQSELYASEVEGYGGERLQEFFDSFIKSCGGRIKELNPDELLIEKTDTGSTLKKTKLHIEEKKTIGEIADIRGLASGTVIDHIERLLDQEMLLSDAIEYLKEASSLMASDYELIHSMFEKIEDDKLRPVKDLLGDEYTYDDLRFARLFYTKPAKVNKEGQYEMEF